MVLGCGRYKKTPTILIYAACSKQVLTSSKRRPQFIFVYYYWQLKHQDSQGYRRQDVVWGGVGIYFLIVLYVKKVFLSNI